MSKKFLYCLMFLIAFFMFNIDVNAATISDGIYSIQSAIANKVVDVDDAKAKNGTNVQLYASNNTNAQKWKVTNLGNDTYEIASLVNENFVLDVDNAGKKNGTNVQIYNRNNTNAQKWTLKYAGDGYYYVISKCSGLYLDVDNAGSANKTNIQTYKGNGTKVQKFKFIEVLEGTQSIEDGIYSITSFTDSNLALSVEGEANKNAEIALSNKSDDWSQLWRVKYLGNGYYSIVSYMNESLVLDVKGGNAANETRLQLYSSNNTNSQKWIVKEVDGYYNIVSALDKMYVDIKDGSIKDNSPIQIYHGNDTNAQKFTFTKVETEQIENGIYTLNSALDNSKVVSVNSEIALNGANVNLQTDSNRNSQKWHVEYLGDGYYSLKSAMDDIYTLDVAGGSLSSGTNVQIYKPNNTNSQKWYIKSAGDGYFYLISKLSNMYLDVDNAEIADGTNIQVYNGNKSDAQKFKLTQTTINNDDVVINQPYEEGYYTIATKLNTNKVLDAAGGEKSNGTNIQLYDYDNVVAQIWYLKKLEDGYYAIISSMNPEIAITAASSDVKNNVNVELSKYTGADTQKWIIKDLGDGYVSIISKASGLVVDVDNANTANRTNIKLYQNNGNDAQKYKITAHTSQKVYNGIDVSYHQGTIDWGSVARTGMDFVIIRAGFGGDWTYQDDKKFLEYVAACEKYNIPYGLYLYSYASEIDNSETSAQAEARHMLRLIDKIEENNYSPNLGTKVFIDMEDESVVTAGKDKLTAVSDTFCSQIEANGYSCGIYANKDWLINNLNTQELAKKYEIWLAEWINADSPSHIYARTKKPTYNLTSYKYWQFASDGNINGINGRVDMDLGYDIFD